MRSLEQLANEGTLVTEYESELVKTQLYDKIFDASIEARVGRQVVNVIKMTGGTTQDIITADKDSMEFRRIGAGANFPIDVEQYTKLSVTPVKWGNSFVITSESQEDSNWDIIKMNLKKAGLEAGVREDRIILDAFNDSTYGFISDTGQIVTSAGTELSVADIADAMETIEDDDYRPDTLILHPTQVGELRQIDTFVEADKVGSRETWLKGFVGKIFGMNVLITTSAWLGGTTDYAWCFDSNYAAALVVKRPLTVKPFVLPQRDSLGVTVSFREEAIVLQPKAGCRIYIQ